MKVIAIVSRKGGSAKTTIATALAVMAESSGLGTILFDCDPQASAAVWSDHRADPNPTVIPAQGPRLASMLANARKQQADLIIIDTPPEADGIATEAAMQADFIIIPCRPSALDLDAIGASVRIARSATKPFAIVITAAPVQGTEVEEMRTTIMKVGVTVVPVVLHHRKAYSAQMAQGRTAQEAEPRGKAAAEIRDLFRWLCGELDIKIGTRQD